MAHFENDQHTRVSGQVLPIRVGGIRTLLLWGGNETSAPLNVISLDPSVLQIHERTDRTTPLNYRRFEIRALRDADKIKVVISADTRGDNPWDYVEFVMLNASESRPYFRDRVIQIACTNLDAHYLWEAAGAQPGMLNGMPGRRGSVALLNQEPQANGRGRYRDLQHSVAVSELFEYNTCAGRSGHNRYVSSLNEVVVFQI